MARPKHLRQRKRDIIGNVYALQEEQRGCVKIGFSKHLGRGRLENCQVGNPDTLIWSGFIRDCGYRTEYLIHQELKPWHIRGEWFVASYEVAFFLAFGMMPDDRNEQTIIEGFDSSIRIVPNDGSRWKRGVLYKGSDSSARQSTTPSRNPAVTASFPDAKTGCTCKGSPAEIGEPAVQLSHNP